MSPAAEFVLVANTRLPSQRAQALQVVQSASAFARAGLETTLIVAERKHTPPLPAGGWHVSIEDPRGPWRVAREVR